MRVSGSMARVWVAGVLLALPACGGTDENSAPGSGASGGSGASSGFGASGGDAGASSVGGAGGSDCEAEDACAESDAECGAVVDACGDERSCGTCADGLLCREGRCVATCDGCTVGSDCHPSGAVDPENPCRSCRPSADAGGFTELPDGSDCDDGSACTESDRCEAGVCGGEPRSCDDGVACNGAEACEDGSCAAGENTCGALVCDAANDVCVTDCSGCLVDGVCYADGATRFGNSCELCDVARSTTALSPNTGATCDAAAGECWRSSGVCSAAGVCEREPAAAGSACGGGTRACAESACDGAGTCATVYAGEDVECGDPRSACSAPDHCNAAGSCVAGSALPLGAECGENAICSGGAASPECSCAAGYEPVGGVCTDIDECARGASDCDTQPDACVDEPGGYRCECPGEFDGDGRGSDGCACARADYSPLCAPWTQVSTRNEHACAISAGALFCWGQNQDGQLGTGDRVSRSLPARVGDATDWELVNAADDHTCGIRDGELYCWGARGPDLGHDGNGLLPERVGTEGDWLTVAGGIGLTCGIRGGGLLYCWGVNADGQVGVGTSQIIYATPERVTSLAEFSAVAVGSRGACALRAGELHCWGAGDVGDGTGVTRLAPVRITAFGDFTNLTASFAQSCALRPGGALYCWGDFVSATPTLRAERGDWTAVSAGFVYSCGVTTTGDAYCSGLNRSGQLGDGTYSSRTAAVAVALGGPWTQIEAGDATTFGIRDGGLYAWGSNQHGRRGTGFGVRRVGSAADWLGVSAGLGTTCGIRGSGELYCWGAFAAGAASGPEAPGARVGSAAGWTLVRAGALHTCGIESGALLCWGDNANGQLGDGSVVERATPAPVGARSDWIDVAVNILGDGYTCGVHADGDLECWGANGSGQLGDGSTIERRSPIAVTGSSWSRVATGDDFSCGIDGGGLFCWGARTDGQLGGGTTGNQTTPLRVGTESAWSAVTAGWSHACGILNGQAWCWGSNSSGQLGIGSSGFEPRSPSVVGASGPWASVEAGASFTCGVTVSGDLHCWGSNDDGVLGTDGPRRAAPVLVSSAGWTEVSLSNGHACGIRDGELYCWGRNDHGVLGTDEGAVPAPVDSGH